MIYHCFLSRCTVLDAKEAEDKYILSVHGKSHVDLIRNISSKRFNSRRNRIASKFNSIYLNEGSSEAAYLAAGSVIEVIYFKNLHAYWSPLFFRWWVIISAAAKPLNCCMNYWVKLPVMFTMHPHAWKNLHSIRCVVNCIYQSLHSWLCIVPFSTCTVLSS